MEEVLSCFEACPGTLLYLLNDIQGAFHLLIQIMIIWIQITEIFNTNGTQWLKSFIYRGQSQALPRNV